MLGCLPDDLQAAHKGPLQGRIREEGLALQSNGSTFKSPLVLTDGCVVGLMALPPPRSLALMLL